MKLSSETVNRLEDAEENGFGEFTENDITPSLNEILVLVGLSAKS